MDVDALVARYAAISEADEEALLEAILTNGWEAGCWLRVPPEKLVRGDPAEVARVIAAVASRPGFHLTLGDDPYVDGLPQSDITGDDPCFIVVSQKCDLIGLLKNEPFVELAPARRVSDKNIIKGRWRNSYREFPIDPRQSSTFLIDVRYRYWLPRIDLLDFEARQALPPDDDSYRARHRFGLRIGQRFNRAALPDRLVHAVMGPLGEIIHGNADAERLFTEWMLYHGGRRNDPPGLIAMYGIDPVEGESADECASREAQHRSEAEDCYQDVVAKLPQVARDALDRDDDDRSGAFDDAELSHAVWRTSWKLDFDAYTFSGTAEGSSPDR